VTAPGAAKNGLLTLSVGLGLKVLHALAECEVDEIGPTRTRAMVFAAPPRR
jgi:hypothetical protein